MTDAGARLLQEPTCESSPATTQHARPCLCRGAASWSKSPTPVFTSNDTTRQYGPGHNSFTVAEDGRTDVLVYHARQYKEIDGDPLNDPNRHTRIQALHWNADGTPHFGIPVADAAADRAPSA